MNDFFSSVTPPGKLLCNVTSSFVGSQIHCLVCHHKLGRSICAYPAGQQKVSRIRPATYKRIRPPPSHDMGFEIPLRSKTAEGVLNTSFEVRKAVGEPPAVIRVRNLKTSISGPQDAWGRKGTLQPMTVSAEISMATAFEASSSTDAVSYDTVHYGLLSKRILSFIQSMNAEKAVLPEGTGYWALPVLVGGLFEELAGRNTNGTKTPMYDSCLLRNQKFQHLGVKVLLPKASLLGSGVSLAAAIWIPNNVQDPICRRSMTATIHELRVPTLVGVNPHERLAKQIVVATVEVERLHTMDINFNELEAVIVKVSETELAIATNTKSLTDHG